MVMMRAFRNAKKRLNEENQCVKAIDCLDWNEGNVLEHILMLGVESQWAPVVVHCAVI
ncbi:hypothetical protein Lser_V15G26168 [Lactuca serriola]